MGAPAMTGFFWVEQLFENGGVAWDWGHGGDSGSPGHRLVKLRIIGTTPLTCMMATAWGYDSGSPGHTR